MAEKKQKPRGSGKDALKLLVEDHKLIKKLFSKFEKLKKKNRGSTEKLAVVEQICFELAVHCKVEEEIVYPAIREVIGDADLMDEAIADHAHISSSISELGGMRPGDHRYDVKVTVLGEDASHHIEEEERVMFRKVRMSKLDRKVLGARMQGHRDQLRAEMEKK